MWNVLPCLRLSVSMSVSVWDGGYSWLCEVTGRHGSNFLPFGGPLAAERVLSACKVWSVKCGVWSVRCAVRSEECKV